jgi:hypothetical protein
MEVFTSMGIQYKHSMMYAMDKVGKKKFKQKNTEIKNF